MITDNIMLGGKEDAEDAALLLEYGVTHILNTAQQLPNYFPQSFVYLKLSLLGRREHACVRTLSHLICSPQSYYVPGQTRRPRTWQRRWRAQ